MVALARALGEDWMKGHALLAAGQHSIEEICDEMGFDDQRSSEVKDSYHATMRGAFCAQRCRLRLQAVTATALTDDPALADPGLMDHHRHLVSVARQAAAVGRSSAPAPDAKVLGDAFVTAQHLARRCGISVTKLLSLAEDGWRVATQESNDALEARQHAELRRHSIDSARLSVLASNAADQTVGTLLRSIALLSARAAVYYRDMLGWDWQPTVPVTLFRDGETEQVFHTLRLGDETAADHLTRQTIQHFTGIAVKTATERNPPSDVLATLGSQYLQWHARVVEAAQGEYRVRWQRQMELSEDVVRVPIARVRAARPAV